MRRSEGSGTEGLRTSFYGFQTGPGLPVIALDFYSSRVLGMLAAERHRYCLDGVTRIALHADRFRLGYGVSEP
jgi:hypothetical protein